MTELHKTAKRAQWQLWLNRWFSTLGWSLAGAGALFATLVLVDRTLLVIAEPEFLYGRLSLVLAGVALLTSIVWTAVTRESLFAAAAELDGAAGLKERISTALYCEKTDDPFGQAVVADARKVTRNLTVRRHLPLRVPYSANYAGPTLLVALLVFLLFPVVDLVGKQEVAKKKQDEQNRIARDAAEVKAVVEKQVETLRQKYPMLSKEDLDKLMALKTQAPTTRPEDIRNEPVKMVNNIAQKYEQKKDNPDLARIDEFRRMAEKVVAQQRSDSAASRLAKAMAQGDYKDAQKALEEMKLELMKAPMTEEQKQKTAELRQEMDKLASGLKQVAANDKKISNELAKTGMKPEEIKRAIEQLNKKDIDGLKNELAKKGLSQKDVDKLVNELKKCQSGCQMASKMGQSLQQAAQGQQGNQGSDQLSESSDAGFSEAADQLSEMEALQQQMNQLNSAVAELKNMQNSLAGGSGQGNRPGEGQGEGEGEGEGEGNGMGPGQGRGGGMGGLGVGEGNIAPVTETGAKTTAQKAKVNTLPGSIISTQFIQGEQIAGDVSAEHVEAVISKQRDVSDAINREAIPRQYHRSVGKYFNHATEGMPSDKVKVAQDKIELEQPSEEAK